MKHLLLTVGLLGTPAMAGNDCDGSRQVVSSPQDYVKLLSSPDRKGKVRVGKLVGRVLKGKTEKDFETLTNDSARKIVFLMGNEGLEQLIGLNNAQILDKIGYTPDYIERLEREGYRFKLVIFKRRGEDGLLATWDNVVRLTEKVYPGVAAKVKAALPELKSKTFSQLQSQAPSAFSTVDKAGATDPAYFDEERLANCEGKPWQVRAFLFYRVRLMDFFSGDGYTVSADGKRGLKEFIVANKPIKLLPAHLMIDLH